MEISKFNLIGIGISVLILAISFLFYSAPSVFFLLVGVAVLIGFLPFVITSINETREENEKEEMFLEFARNLVESVKTGTPISRSIVNVKDKSYGVLTPHVEKLANQIYLGVSLKSAFQTFARDVNNKTISRAITLIGQAEKSGGDIGEILEAVAGAVTVADKLKKERKAALSALVVQGYVIFFIFMIIVLVMQFKIMPMLSGITNVQGGGLGQLGMGGQSGGAISPEELSNSFLYLLLAQGLFSGLTIGKLSEGNVKSGVKHSFALMLAAFLISASAKIIMGGV